MIVKRGMVVAYRDAPQQPLLIISDPSSYNGMTIVTAKSIEKYKSHVKYGLYAVDSLVPFADQTNESTGSSP